MSPSTVSYLTFGVVIILAVIFDLGLLSKKGATVTIRRALFQTGFWVLLAMAFFGFLWYEDGSKIALEYFSAYLMEWSLSIDNIFVFILIFSFFKVKPEYYGRVLLIGILMAILLRIIFITVGIAAISLLHEILYVFGAFLVYTGIMMFRAREEESDNLEENRVYRWLKRILPLTDSDGNGKMTTIENGKKRYTTLFVVVVMLATTDVIFAIDSIPAVFGISKEKIVVYTSNIFAVLGLRSLFFLLRGAVNKFSYLQQGIAIVLVFVGVKMLVEFWHIVLPVYVSLLVILFCVTASIAYSLYKNKKTSR